MIRSLRSITVSGLFLLILLSCSTESTPVYQLTTSSNPTEGGTVSPVPGEYDEGEEVNVTATPNENWTFEKWQGGLLGTQNPVTVTMDADKDITALFIKKEYPLTVNIEGEGAVAEQVVQQKSTDYPHGTVVELTANPSEGWEFVEWQGSLEGDENPQTITVDEAKTVTAVFEQKSLSISVQIEGEGSLNIEPAKEEYKVGDEVEIIAKAKDGWLFSHWSGDLKGNENPIKLTMNDDKNISATFNLAPNTTVIELPNNDGITLFEASNAKNGVMFISTEEIVYGGGNNGIWRSDNYGQTWTKTESENVNFISIGYNNPDLIIAGHDEGYLISTDGGVSWKSRVIKDELFGDPILLAAAAIIDEESAMYIVSADTFGAGLYKSNDAGKTWKRIFSRDDVEEPFDALLLHLAMSPENPNTIYTSTGSDFNIWRSKDGGKNFFSIKKGITINSGAISGGLLVNPFDSKELIIGGHVSSDGGSSWVHKGVSPIRNAWVNDVLIKVENSIIMGSEDLGDSWFEVIQLEGENLPNITNPRLSLSKNSLFLNTGTDIFRVDLSIIESKL